MPTPRFNENIIRVSRRLQDAREDASAAGDTNRRYKSALLALFQNMAIRAILIDTYASLKHRFGKNIPEYVTTSAGITIVDGAVTPPADHLYVLGLTSADGATVYDELAQEEVQNAIAHRDGITEPTLAKPVYYLEGGTIKVLPESLVGNVLVRYVKKHADITVNGATDILLNPRYDDDIVNRMFSSAMKDASMIAAQT